MHTLESYTVSDTAKYYEFSQQVPLYNVRVEIVMHQYDVLGGTPSPDREHSKEEKLPENLITGLVQVNV